MRKASYHMGVTSSRVISQPRSRLKYSCSFYTFSPSLSQWSAQECNSSQLYQPCVCAWRGSDEWVWENCVLNLSYWIWYCALNLFQASRGHLGIYIPWIKGELLYYLLTHYLDPLQFGKSNVRNKVHTHTHSGRRAMIKSRGPKLNLQHPHASS